MQSEILEHHRLIKGKNDQHYVRTKESRMEYDLTDLHSSELGSGELGLKARGRQDISRLRSAYKKVKISTRFKGALELRERRIGGDKYLGLKLANKDRIIFIN